MSALLQLAREPWAQVLGWSLLHFLWQGALLGGLAWAALALLRGASARARYGVACTALLLMAAAPVLTFLHLQVAAAAGAAPGSVRLVVEEAVASPRPLALRTQSALEGTLPWLLAGWALGVAVLSLRFLGGWVEIQRLRRRSAKPVPAEWHLVLSRLCRELRLSRTVRLLQSAAVEVPAALGWLRPVILLPACALTGLAPDQLEAVLAHELAHIRRGDFAVNLLQTLVEVLLFYHPAVWWLSGRIRAERELCCDDVAAALCGDPLTLARALTRLESLREPHPRPASRLVLAANGGSLMLRIRHLLQPSLPPSPRARAGAVALLAVSLLGAAGAALQDRAPKAQPAPTGPQAPNPEAKGIRMKILDGDRRLNVRMKGEVRLDPGAANPVAVAGAGSFRVEEQKAGRTRRFAATKDRQTYTVDGQAKALDAEGGDWLRAVVTDTVKAQAGREKARRMELRARDMEALARDQEAHGQALEAHARALEASLSKELSPEVQARMKAELARAQKDLEKAQRIRVEVVEKDGDRHLLLRQDGKVKDIALDRFGGMGGAEGDAQLEMAELKAEMAALRARMAELKRRMAQMPRAPKPPAPPATLERVPAPPPPPAPPAPPAPAPPPAPEPPNL